MRRVRRRRRVRRQLERVRHRIARLVGAEKNRDAVTAKRKARYRDLRERLGDDAPKTKRALRAYRASRELSHKIDESEAVLRQRAADKEKWLREHPAPLDPDGDGLILIDGCQVSEEVGREVLRIRGAGRWKGEVVSGFRTPEHSRELCRGICGADTCPGRCAGTTSRHTKKGARDGAVDLTEWWDFRDECARLDSWLENHLPIDPVHFSDIGN